MEVFAVVLGAPKHSGLFVTGTIGLTLLNQEIAEVPGNRDSF